MIQKHFRDQIKEILSSYSEGVSFDVSYPRNEFGHYASNLAFPLAKQQRKDPMKIAGEIVGLLEKDKKAQGIFEDISVASPGFINITLSNESLHKILATIINRGAIVFGKNEQGKGSKINIEFVSGNPTGPLVVNSGRSASYGDSLARVLEFSGFGVTREYFINDAGNQVSILGESVARRYLEIEGEKIDFPENMYQGEYIKEIAQRIKDENIFKGDKNDFDALKNTAKEYAIDFILKNIKDTVGAFGLDFDVWFSEKILHEEGKIDEVLLELQKKGLAYESEGALWFKATEFGLEKDIVLKRSIGDKLPTYIASDFAYARDKSKRGFDKNIYIFGADHHADVSRIKAGIEALGLNSNEFEFIIHQMITVKTGGKAVRMSKRKGIFIFLSELMEEVPVDVIKYLFLIKSLDKHIEFDLDLAKEESNKNPVYYIQYAHARARSLLRTVKEHGLEWDKKIKFNDLAGLSSREAIKLLLIMGRFPEVVEDTARDYQVHRIAQYAYDLASAIHLFYDTHRVTEIDRENKKASFIEGGENNLLIILAGSDILRQALSLIGISAPEKM